MQSKCGAQFGFGNKLVTFNKKTEQVQGGERNVNLFKVHQKGTDSDLVQRV